MRDLMADYEADSAIIYGIIAIGKVKWWLKNACREINIILGRIIIRIDSRWRHLPFRAVNRFADFPDIPVERIIAVARRLAMISSFVIVMDE